MVNYTVFNGSDAQFTAGATPVPARSKVTGITLTDAELAAVCVRDSAAVMQDAPTAAEQAAVSVCIADANSAGLDLSTKAKVKELKLRRSREDAKQLTASL